MWLSREKAGRNSFRCRSGLQHATAAMFHESRCCLVSCFDAVMSQGYVEHSRYTTSSPFALRRLLPAPQCGSLKGLSLPVPIVHAPRMPRTATGRKLLEETLVERQDGNVHCCCKVTCTNLRHVPIFNRASRGVRTAAEARKRAFQYAMMALRISE